MLCAGNVTGRAVPTQCPEEILTKTQSCVGELASLCKALCNAEEPEMVCSARKTARSKAATACFASRVVGYSCFKPRIVSRKVSEEFAT